jgi:hypothetical protein
MNKRIVLSVVVFVLGLLTVTATIDTMLRHTPLNRLDQRSSHYYTEALERAIYTYAVVRGMNAVISVLQGTDIAVSPAGVGVRMAVGEILDPVNDLLERFSWVMLVSTASLGIQKVLLEIGAWLGLRVFLSVALAVLLVAIWLPPIHRRRVSSFSYKLLVAALIIRFGLPLVALASEKLYDIFLEDTYFESSRVIEDINREIKSVEIPGGEGDASDTSEGYLGALKGMVDQTVSALDLKNRIIQLKDRIANFARYTVDLITVFVLQTLVIPLLVLWGLIKLTGHWAGGRLSASLESKFNELVGGKSAA